MKLILDPSDLLEEFQRKGENDYPEQAIPTRDVTFDKLNACAQEAVILIGKGTFITWNRSEYISVEPTR